MGNTYIFIDESGEKHTSAKASKYFMIHGLVINEFDYNVIGEILKLRMDTYFDTQKRDKTNKFHASEDKQIIRDAVFSIIQKLKLENNFVFSVILEKSKGYSPWNLSFNKYHQLACQWLLGGALHDLVGWDEDDELIVCFDSMPGSDNKDKEKMIKGIKLAIADFLDKKKFKTKFSIFHQESSQNPYLQIIDYIGWAIFKKFEREDVRSYELIEEYILNIFLPFDRKSLSPRNELKRKKSLLNKKTSP